MKNYKNLLMAEIATDPRLNKGKIINQETMINKNKDKSLYGKDESNNLNEHNNKGTSNNDNNKRNNITASSRGNDDNSMDFWSGVMNDWASNE